MRIIQTRGSGVWYPSFKKQIWFNFGKKIVTTHQNTEYRQIQLYGEYINMDLLE